MFETADVDLHELEGIPQNQEFWDQHYHLRLVNSFLFSFSKIQDRMGAKLFKLLLLELREIDSDAIPMRDVLNKMSKLGLIDDPGLWDRLREIRNLLSHDYPDSWIERSQNLSLAIEGYGLLKSLFEKIRIYVDQWDL